MLGGHTLIWKLKYELMSVRREIPKLQNLKNLELCWKINYLIIKHWLSEIRKNHFDVVYFLRYSLHTAAYLFLSLSSILNFMSLNGMSLFYFPQSETLMLILLIHAKKRKQWGASSGYLKFDQFFFLLNWKYNIPITPGYASLSASGCSIHINFLLYLSVQAQHPYFINADTLKLSRLTWQFWSSNLCCK